MLINGMLNKGIESASIELYKERKKSKLIKLIINKWIISKQVEEGESSEGVLENGLVIGHAYSITSVKTVTCLYFWKFKILVKVKKSLFFDT